LLLDVPTPNDTILQKIAREMNLSETAFVSWKDKATLEFNLRWLTPTTEVNLCGHATLATAHILLTETDIGKTG
jgi:PhzF family phenazine biosynthesis protein